MNNDHETTPAAKQPSHAIQIMIADDHPIVRRGIANELSQHPDMEVLGEAANGNDVLQSLQTHAFDVLVLDINMPGMRAVDLLHQLSSHPKPPQTLILTAHNDPEHILAMLKAGAKGYMLKDELPETIIAAVRAVARGETWLSPSLLSSMIMYTTGAPIETPGPMLSSRETEVLSLLVEGRDNREIGGELCISERTVRFHLRNIYDKVGVRGRGEAIAWGVRQQFKQR